MFELLTPKQMNMADQFTIDSGVPGIELMNAAGAAVAETAIQEFADIQNILVVCGTGNNGGDGLVAAQKLLTAGKKVHVFISGDIAKIDGDARLALEKVDRTIIQDSRPEFCGYDLIIDALLGAGLDRPVRGEIADLISEINNRAKSVLAVDLPSGIDGKTGQVMGTAVKAKATCTFFRFKPGHVLMPGRSYCGELHLAKIGIHPDAINKAGYTAIKNCPEVWEGEYCSALRSSRDHLGGFEGEPEFSISVANDAIGGEKSLQREESIVLLFEEAFSKSFPAADRLPSKIEKARAAASSSGATIVFGGADTVVASPDGDASVSDMPTVFMEKSGYDAVFKETADKFVAQGMTDFSAANAAIWICAKAADRIRPDLSRSTLRIGINAQIQDFSASLCINSEDRHSSLW